MKRIRTYFLIGALLTGFFTIDIMTTDVSAAAQVIKLTTLAPKGSSFHKSLQKMGESWRNDSGGTIKLIIYAGGILGGEAAMVDRMKINQSQAGLLTTVGLKEIEPAVTGLQSMPMMFRDLDEVDYIGKKLQPKLESRLLRKGFVVLFWADTGWVRFFSKEPVLRPDDLKKMKLFTWSGDPDTVNIMHEVGLNPVPLETGDILTGLQTGLINAVPMPPFYALASQIYTPAPHMLELNWAPLVGAAVVTSKAWDKIPPALQEKMMRAAVQAGEEIKKTGRRESDESVKAMVEKWGLKVHPVSPALETEWRQVAQTAYPAIRGKIVPAEIFDEVTQLLNENQATLAGTE